MKKVSVIGHFAYGLEYFDGQTVKTKILTNELCKVYGQSEVLQFDTHGGKKTLLKAPLYAWKALRESKNVVILPAHNGLRVFGRLLPIFRRFFKNRKIHYVVIGGWLPQMLESNRTLAKALKKFDGIYVETKTMKMALEKQGFENIFEMPNCKELTPLAESELIYQNEAPYKLCTFSRVMKEKGIEDAIEAVKIINYKYGRVVYTLDIYGQVDSTQTEWFSHLKNDLPEFIRYCGLVPFDKSVDILKSYYALLFPTYYEGEGFAGTLLDAFAAGVPVIASDWHYNSEIIIQGETGVLFPPHNTIELSNKLIMAFEHKEKWNGMKIDCLKKSKQYLPESVCRILFNSIDNNMSDN